MRSVIIKDSDFIIRGFTDLTDFTDGTDLTRLMKVCVAHCAAPVIADLI